MNTTISSSNNKRFKGLLIIILMLQVIAAFYFCTQKQGFHYDEFYSYYSTNVTYGLVPTDEEWKSHDEIISEFVVDPGEKFDYKRVSLMQSYDVHPPLYYFVLHTVCSLTPGVFSKWQGLTVNLIFFVLSWLVLCKIVDLQTDGNQRIIFATLILYGFSPAVYSGITFIRMYMMLTFLCFLCLYIHMRGFYLEKKKFFNYYLPVLLVSFLGFMTHYYFIVFLFFVAAFTFFAILFEHENKKHIPCYVASVIGGLLLAVMAYPACLSHIFRGYRGTEAKAAFFDLSNLSLRLTFFLDLIDEYVFGGTFYVTVLTIILLLILMRYLNNRSTMKKTVSLSEVSTQTDTSQSKSLENFGYKKMLTCIIVTTLGYYLVVAKTALLNAEEAIRYEMPIYGLLILLLVFFLYEALNGLFQKHVEISKYAFIGVTAMIFATQVHCLQNNGVLFLYPQDKENITWAMEHTGNDIVYIYNPNNQWMIWDDSAELLAYKDIYFIDMNHDSLKKDERLANSDHMYAYAMRGEQSEKILLELQKMYPQFKDLKLIRANLYCDLYEYTVGQ